MRTKVILILLVLNCLSTLAFSQRRKKDGESIYESIDKKVREWNYSVNSIKELNDKINESFTLESDKCRAIFYWVTTNINFSADLMFTYQTSGSRSKTCKDAFDNRKAVCIGYACLFDSLCKLSNIRSYIVEGSTRQKFLAGVVGHAYNVVYIDGKWNFIDATWGGGYLINNQFVRKLDDSYYLTDAETIIQTHYPLDPIWQLSSRPLNLYQFYSNSGSTAPVSWNFEDSIDVYTKLSEIEKIQTTMRRLKEFGTESEVTINYYNYLNSKQEYFYVGKYNNGLSFYNESVKDFNNYINFKNKQFLPARSDKELAEIYPPIISKINTSEMELIKIRDNLSEANKKLLADLLEQIAGLREKVAVEMVFVNKYLSTPKNKRRDLFYVRMDNGKG